MEDVAAVATETAAASEEVQHQPLMLSCVILSRPSLSPLTESEIVLNSSLASLIDTFCSSIIPTDSSIVCSTCCDLIVISLTICLISSVDCCDCSASFLISSATTAYPLPLSPALAASIEALSDMSVETQKLSNKGLTIVDELITRDSVQLITLRFLKQLYLRW